MKIKNMTSTSGNKVANQFIVDTDEGQFFQSYDTMIAFKPADGSTVTLDVDAWDYSTTTSKYRNKFLGMDSKQVKRGIKDGSIILAKLN